MLRIRSVGCFVFFLFCVVNSFAQTDDERAEAIQNGTADNFLSADGSYFKGDNFSTHSPYGYGYWVTAHALEGLADAYQRTRNPVYRDRMKNIIAGIRQYNLYQQGTYRNDFYDDLEWLCLAAFNCYNVTKDPEYLDAVHQIWAEIKTGYYDGVMAWKKGCPTCNNSIAQGPAIILAVKLYQLEGDPANLQMAKDIHAWMKRNVFNEHGGIWDSRDNHALDWQFSYNSGMFIGACLALSIVTGEQSYVQDGIKASEFMINDRMYEGGVFFLNEKGQGDGGLFKGIFAKWFAEFVRAADLSPIERDRYAHIINYTANYTWENGVDRSSYLVNYDWGAVPSVAIHLSTQISGVHLFEAIASLNKVHLYQDIDYAGFYSQFLPGSYTLAQLEGHGVNDNDITSFTIPDGYAVIVYEHDNFTGASSTFTSNTKWLDDWNDKITSMRIVDLNASVVSAIGLTDGNKNIACLNIGDYDLQALLAAGIDDNSIDSFRVMRGYKVIAYSDDNFSGQSVIVTSAARLDELAGRVSSLKIKANGDTTMGNTTFLLKNRNSGLYMEVKDASMADETDIVQKLFRDGENQKFKFFHLGDGLYQVQAEHSGKGLEVASLLKENGLRVVQNTYDHSDNQQFIALATDDGYHQLISEHSGKIIEVANSGKTSGMHLQQWTNNKQSAGQWKLTRVSIVLAAEDDEANSFENMYPNPTQHSLFFKSDLSGASIHIFSSTGLCIHSGQMKGDSLDVSHLQDGVYVVMIQEKGVKTFRRFVKCNDCKS